MHLSWKYVSFSECNRKAAIRRWSFEACRLWCKEPKTHVSVMWMLLQVAVVETVLTNNFTDKELQLEIRYRQWMNNNCGIPERSKLSGTVSDAINSIGERLEKYLFHVFIKWSQAASFVERRRNLNIGQALFYFDFSEKYPLCHKMKYKADTGTMLSAIYLQQWFTSKTPRTII